MILEILYPQIASHFGDSGNVRYLKAAFAGHEVCETKLQDEPRFVSEHVDMLYLGSMSESALLKVTAALRPYKERLRELISAGTTVLLTGNAIEVLLERTETEQGEVIPGLGLYPFVAKRDLFKRYSDYYTGKTDDGLIVVGYKALFTRLWGDNSKKYLFNTVHGLGFREENPAEGLRDHNLFATYLLGPFLPMNPEMTKRIFATLPQMLELPFADLAGQAYAERLPDFVCPDTKM